MYRRIIGAVVVLTIAVVLGGIGLKGYEKKAQAAEHATKTDIPKSETTHYGMKAAKSEEQMTAMCPMHGMMMGSMMCMAVVSTEDGGVIVLAGDKLLRYDKDLSLTKEVKIEMDLEGTQKKMAQMMEKCPMCRGMMHGKGMMHREGMMKKPAGE